MSPVSMPPSPETYCCTKGLSRPSSARLASMTSWATAPLSPYISVIASLPAMRIMAKDKNVIPIKTGISWINL